MPQNLVPVRLSVPGSLGLNTQRKADLLPAQWATVAENCVFDDSGRLASRKGTQRINTTAVSGSPNVRAFHEYIDATGASIQIFAAGNKIYKVNGSSLVEITGTITTPTADKWKFVNFNGKCVGIQPSHAPIVLATTGGSFADIALTGTQQPTTSTSEILAAFGRLWVLDGTDLKYSDSLAETAWNGVFDLSTVWLSGMDVGVALAEFNGYLIVFGKNSIVVYSNPWVPTGGGGIDTSTMELIENLGGVGCLARDSVQPVGKDLVFLSYQGVRSLGRTIQEKSMPITVVSENVNDELVRLALGETPVDISSAFSTSDRAYILSFPTNNITYYIDMRSPLPDGSYRVTTWDTSFACMGVTQTKDVYFGKAGYLTKYTGYLDDVLSDGTGGSPYTMDFVSGWSDLSDINPQLSSLSKIPKKADFLILGGSGQTATLKWAYDFQDSFTLFLKDLPSSSSAEWGLAEWGPQYVTGLEDPESLPNDEWSGGLIFNHVKAPMSRKGLVLKLGFSVSINGDAVALQLLDFLLKIGRMN